MDLKLLHLFRSIIFGFITVQSFILAYIYEFGYNRVKHTEIIRVLVMFFLHLGMFFAYLTFIASSMFFGSPLYEPATFYLGFFAIPLLWFLIRFRKISMDDEEEIKNYK